MVTQRNNTGWMEQHQKALTLPNPCGSSLSIAAGRSPHVIVEATRANVCHGTHWRGAKRALNQNAKGVRCDPSTGVLTGVARCPPNQMREGAAFCIDALLRAAVEMSAESIEAGAEYRVFAFSDEPEVARGRNEQCLGILRFRRCRPKRAHRARRGITRARVSEQPGRRSQPKSGSSQRLAGFLLSPGSRAARGGREVGSESMVVGDRRWIEVPGKLGAPQGTPTWRGTEGGESARHGPPDVSRLESDKEVRTWL